MKTTVVNRWASRIKMALAGAAAAWGVGLVTPTDAKACGGFFCSSVPIDQSGERVLFAVGEETVKAHIQIFYQGEADKFSWVLPLPAAPSSIGVGSDAVFTALEQQTTPQFYLDWNYKNDCNYNWGWGFEADAGAGGGPSPAPPGENGGVDVLQAGAVGPYDFVVVKAAEGGDGAEAMYQWLETNGYDQPDNAKVLIAEYVEENHVFVAVKLQQDKKVGDIQPLTLEYPFPGSCVPLRLTSIAATEDMNVWVYVLGKERAVPVNFFHVTINEAKIDWLGYGGNYRDVAMQAVDTAAGRGFLTEYSGDTLPFKDTLYRPGKFDLEGLAGITDPMEYLNQALNMGLPRSATMQEIIKTYIPKPENLPEDCNDDQEFYTWNMQACLAHMPADWDFDPVAMTADVDAKIVTPLKEADALFDEHRTLTRLFTVISPSEMVRDPIFLFNPDLPNVSNIHRAVAEPVCEGGSTTATKVQVTLEDGSLVQYDVPKDFGPPILTGDAVTATPGTVEQMFTEGLPEAVPANTIATVEQSFDSITVGLLTAPNQEPTPPRVKTNSTSNAGGCTSTGPASPGGFGATLGLGLLAAALLRRRA